MRYCSLAPDSGRRHRPLRWCRTRAPPRRRNDGSKRRPRAVRDRQFADGQRSGRRSCRRHYRAPAMCRSRAPRWWRSLGRCRSSEVCAKVVGVRTCRDAVLDAFTRLERRHGRTTFQLEEVVAETLAHDRQYKESTVRTHVTSRMCVNAPENHASVYGDLIRVDRGMYRRQT